MLRAYKYRLYPDSEQVTLFNKTFGCVRVIWNRFVAAFNSYDKNTNPKPVYKSSTEIKAEFDWMKEVSAAALQQKERDFMTFKSAYFSRNRKTKIKRCKFKVKGSRQSYRLPAPKFSLDPGLGSSYLRLEKIGRVKVLVDREPKPGYKPLSATISKDCAGAFFVSVLVDEMAPEKFPAIDTSSGCKNAVGIDLGLKHYITLSTGEKIENPEFLRESQAKLRKAQRNLSRKIRGSNRYKKCKVKVARIHRKVTNQRKWFQHQVSLDLLRRFEFIGVESLNVSGMVKNRKLARSISDAGWSQFLNLLQYKALWYGRQIQEIGTFFPSSKTCSDCGQVNQDLVLGDREWACKSCGVIHDRDINAAVNIEQEALKIYALGVPSAQRTQSQCKTA